MPTPDHEINTHVTALLGRVRSIGDEAAGELLPLVYDELRALAALHMRRERDDHTLQATALVNEVYVKLTNDRDARFANRAHFFGVAANAMRRILVDHARKHNAEKRGGGRVRERLTLCGLPDANDPARELDIVGLHEALEKIESMDKRVASVVELRFFGGLTIAETAGVLGVSHSTVEDDWAFARAWLRKQMEADRDG